MDKWMWRSMSIRLLGALILLSALGAGPLTGVAATDVTDFAGLKTAIEAGQEAKLNTNSIDVTDIITLPGAATIDLNTNRLNGASKPRGGFTGITGANTLTLTNANSSGPTAFTNVVFGVSLQADGQGGRVLLNNAAGSNPKVSGGVFAVTNWHAGSHTLLSSDQPLSFNSTLTQDIRVGGYRTMWNDPGKFDIATDWANNRFVNSIALVGNDVVWTTALANNLQGNTIYWTGAVDNKVSLNHSAMNWRSGSSDSGLVNDLFLHTEDTLYFTGVGSSGTAPGVGHTDVEFIDAVTEAGGIYVKPIMSSTEPGKTRNYDFTTGAVHLSKTGFQRDTGGTVKWTLRGGSAAHKMDAFRSNLSSAGETYLIGDHAFTPYTDGAKIKVSLGGPQEMFYQGNISFDQSEALVAGINNIASDASLTFTGSSNVKFQRDLTTADPTVKLGADGTLTFDAVQGVMTLQADQNGGTNTFTELAAGAKALELDGATQEMRVYSDSRLNLHNKNAASENIDFVLDGGTLQVSGGSVLTARHDGESLRMTDGSKVVLNNASGVGDANNSTLGVTGDNALHSTKTITYDGTNRLMTLSPGTVVTLDDKTTAALSGIDWKIEAGKLIIGKDAHLVSKSLTYNSTVGAFAGLLELVKGTVATLAENTDGTTVLDGHTILVDASTMTADAAKGTVIAGETITFSNKASLTAGASANTIAATGNVTFSGKSSLEATGATADTVLSAANVSFTDSTFTAATSHKAIAATGNVNFKNSPLTAGATTDAVISGAAVAINNSPVEVGTSEYLIKATGAVEITGASASNKNSVKAGAVHNTLISGSSIALQNVELTVENSGTLLSSTGTVSVASSMISSGDTGVVIAGDIINIKDSTLKAAPTEALFNTVGGDVTVSDSVLEVGGNPFIMIDASNLLFNNSTLKAETARYFFAGDDITFTNSTLDVGAATGAVISGYAVTFDGSKITMREVSGKPAINATDFTFANSTLSFKPDANVDATLIHVVNLPTFSGSNTLDFIAVPNGSYTLVQTEFENPEDQDLIAVAYDKAITSIGDRITVNGIAIDPNSGSRVDFDGLAYNKDQKSLEVSMSVVNEERTWTGAGTGPGLDWAEADRTVIVGDRIVFNDSATDTHVMPISGILASDVIVTGDKDFVFDGSEGFTLAVNGTNVTIDGKEATGLLLKQGDSDLTLLDMGNVRVQNGLIESGSLTLVNSGLGGISETNRGAIAIAEGATLRLPADTDDTNAIYDYADVVVSSGARMELGSRIQVATTSSLTLEEGAVILLDENTGFSSAHIVADGIQPLEAQLAQIAAFAADTTNWGVVVDAATGIQVNPFGRWQAQSVATYSDGGLGLPANVSVDEGGALSVYGGGQHVFAEGSTLNMAQGSILHMDLTNRSKDLAAVDSTDAGADVSIDGARLYVSSSSTASGEWLIWANADAIDDTAFDPTVTFVEASTLTPIVKTDEEGNIVDSENALSIEYRDTEAWLSASITEVYGDVSDYETNYYKERNHGKPNVRRALRRWDHEGFAEMAITSSRWYLNGGWSEGNKYAFAEQLIANSSNLTPEGMLTTYGANVNLFRRMTDAFLDHMGTGMPSVASTNSLQFTGLDTPRSAERLVGSFRGSRGLQAQAEGNRLESTLRGTGDLIANNLFANSLVNNWKPGSESTRNLLLNADGTPSLHAAGGASVGYGARFFGGYLGSFSTQDSDSGYSGYDTHMNGFMLGLSYDFNPHWSLGAYVAYTTGTTDFDDIDTEVDTDATQGGLALTYKHGNGFRVTGDLGYGHFENDSTRKLNIYGRNYSHSGDSDQEVYSVGLGFAYDWNPEFSPMTTITPFLNLRYAHSETDGYKESGRVLPVRMGDSDHDSFTSSLGLSLSHDFLPKDNVVITPRLTLGWLHEYGDENLSANAGFVGSNVNYTTRSYEQDTDKFQGGASLDFLILNSNDTAIGVKLMYGAEVGGNGVDQNVYGGLEFRF